MHQEKIRKLRLCSNISTALFWGSLEIETRKTRIRGRSTRRTDERGEAPKRPSGKEAEPVQRKERGNRGGISRRWTRLASSAASAEREAIDVAAGSSAVGRLLAVRRREVAV